MWKVRLDTSFLERHRFFTAAPRESPIQGAASQWNQTFRAFSTSAFYEDIFNALLTADSFPLPFFFIIIISIETAKTHVRASTVPYVKLRHAGGSRNEFQLYFTALTALY